MLLSLWEHLPAIFRKRRLSVLSSDGQGFGKALVGGVVVFLRGKRVEEFLLRWGLVNNLSSQKECQNCHLCLSEPVCSRRQNKTHLNSWSQTSGCEFGHWGRGGNETQTSVY